MCGEKGGGAVLRDGCGGRGAVLRSCWVAGVILVSKGLGVGEASGLELPVLASVFLQCLYPCAVNLKPPSRL